jgi:hypothetical protein
MVGKEARETHAAHSTVGDSRNAEQSQLRPTRLLRGLIWGVAFAQELETIGMVYVGDQLMNPRVKSVDYPHETPGQSDSSAAKNEFFNDSIEVLKTFEDTSANV